MASVGDGGATARPLPPPDPGRMRGGRSGWSRCGGASYPCRRWFRLLVAGGFLVFLVTRFDVDLSETWAQVRGANPWLLAAAFAVHYTTFLFRGARWRILLQQASGAGWGDGRPDSGGVVFQPSGAAGWFVNSIGLAAAGGCVPGVSVSGGLRGGVFGGDRHGVVGAGAGCGAGGDPAAGGVAVPAGGGRRQCGLGGAGHRGGAGGGAAGGAGDDAVGAGAGVRGCCRAGWRPFTSGFTTGR